MRQERRRHATLPGVGTPRALTLHSTSADEASGALPVRTADELGPLISEITSDTRSWAVIGLTSRHGQDRPALSPATVRAIVGPTVSIYLIWWRVTISLDVPLHRIGWVMAMVASGRAPAISGLSVHPLVTGTGRASQLIRARDGAKGWRCTLSHISGGPRLHYWILPSGVIEFEAVGYHDKLSSSIR